MYESYPWPGAYTIKDEFKMLTCWIKGILSGMFKEHPKH